MNKQKMHHFHDQYHIAIRVDVFSCGRLASPWRLWHRIWICVINAGDNPVPVKATKHLLRKHEPVHITFGFMTAGRTFILVTTAVAFLIYLNFF